MEQVIWRVITARSNKKLASHHRAGAARGDLWLRIGLRANGVRLNPCGDRNEVNVSFLVQQHLKGGGDTRTFVSFWE